MPVVGDNPIRRAEDDALGRAAGAQHFARQVMTLDASDGIVVGVLGAWGSGKTSFINLTREQLDSAGTTILDFNPWMFSGAEPLVQSFFVELAAQLKLKPGLEEVGKDLEDYGEAFSGLGWLPLVGPWIERGRATTKLLGRLLQRRKEGVGDRRARLEKALRALRAPIVVVLDDIDRLTTSEIRDIFKLIRLTASFPNIIYLVAFDRARVQQALGENRLPGRAYLEKILQLTIDLPGVPEQLLTRRILTSLDDAVSDIENPGELDEEVWSDIFMEILRPLIGNMRDVRRYAAAIHGTVAALEGQIAVADVLAMEAVRVFLPDVLAQFHGAVAGLTTTSSIAYQTADPPELKASVEALLPAAGANEDVIRALITRLFPAGARHIGGTRYGPDSQRRWLRERRVAHPDILRLYLERIAGEGLIAFRDAERAWALLSDRDALDKYLRGLDRDRLEDVIAALENYEEEFRAEQVTPATVVLLNLLPELPEKPQGMFELDPRLVVGRVTYRLLRSLDDRSLVEAEMRQILPEVRSLSSKLSIITDVGYREGGGHQLVSKQAACNFERHWRDDVRAADVGTLVAEHDLLRVLAVAKTDAAEGEPDLSIPDDPSLTVSVLQSALTEVRGQTMGSRAVRRSPRLAWDTLVTVYGSEKIVRDRWDALESSRIGVDDQLRELVQRHLSGWRPQDFPPADRGDE